jgi:Pyruvate/2-oxoacid:ferredoxin oxidoreductase gamma subunit
MHVTEKTEYDITVMRGPSIAELIISPGPISFTGITEPDVIVALSSEGVARRQDFFGRMRPEGLVIRDRSVQVPPTQGQVIQVDFKGAQIKKAQKALAALVLLAKTGKVINLEMLKSAMEQTYQGEMLRASLALMERTLKLPSGKGEKGGKT